jgi:ATP-dependent DNA helicase DinG
MPSRRASSSCATSTAATPISWLPPIASCSWRAAAGRWASSRQCARCGPWRDAGLQLYAQHVDRLDTGALVDLFRAEENACLLGTDALRDGVDVPGRSLRLVVFDKVPWPKPTILHKARRARFGKSYDDLLTRLKLKQAFGRLIRSQDDKGCFVILEPATPSRLLTAFPPLAPIRRCGLADASAEIRAFLAD